MKRDHSLYLKKEIAFLLAFLALIWLGVQPAAAHAVPVISSPQPNEVLETAPAEVSIRFNEPVVTDLSRISVLTQAGQTLEVGAVQAVDEENRTLVVSLPELGNGAYLVSWQVLSAVDGHTTSGSFSFGVGVTAVTGVPQDVSISAQLSLIDAAARWLTFTGTALVLGLFAFRLFIWNPIFTGVELEPEEEVVDVAHGRAALKIAAAGLVLLLVALVLIFINQSETYNLLEAANLRTWLGTRFGQMWLRRGLVVLAFGFGLADLFVGLGKERASLYSWEWWVGLVLGLALALTSSLVSHSAALINDTLQAVLVDFAHIVAASIWVGGLLYLALGLWKGRGLSPSSRTWLNLSLILNFSAVGALSIGVLLASGVYLSWQHIGSWTALVGTAYGLTLLVKLALALLAIALAGINLLFIKPRLDRAFETPEAPASAAALRRFGQVVRLEALVALLILLAAGFLTDLQRGKDAPLLSDAPGEMSVTEEVDDLRVTLSMEPALVGQNVFDVYLEDADGRPVADASEVSLRYTFLDQSIGADTGTAESQGDGHYRLEGSYISLAGNWQVEVAIRRPDTYDSFAPFRLSAGVGGTIEPATGRARPLEQFTRIMTLAGGGITGAALVLIALAWGFVATRAAKNEWQLLPLLAMSVMAFWLGATQLFNFFTYDFTPATFLTNPIVPDAESIAIGQRLFEENCVTCHGPLGRGDGPSAVSLNPPPADFTGGHTATHPDGDLYYWIRNGIENTAMPGFGDKLTSEEAWHLVNYVRRLSTQSSQQVSQ